MAEDTGQERTEEPTARRLKKARDEGQVARSIELPAAAVVISTLVILALSGSWIASKLTSQFASGLVFDRKTLDSPGLMAGVFADQAAYGFLVIMPILATTLVMAVVASGMTGGFLFSGGNLSQFADWALADLGESR